MNDRSASLLGYAPAVDLPRRASLPTIAPDLSQPAHVARWRPRSVLLIVAIWFVLHIGGLFSPGLLDDVDSIYIEIARQMLLRHDFVTPAIDGIRFFDKPPLMYWLAAGSMNLFGAVDWAARLPLALLTLALLLAIYALGLRLFAGISPVHAPDRGGLYAALALGTSLGPYIYTRFFIADIVVTLWLTLSIHLFLLAVERASDGSPQSGRWWRGSGTAGLSFRQAGRTSLPAMLGFALTVALSLLTKGLIGMVFPLSFAALYLLITRQVALVRRLSLLPATGCLLAFALPWHLLAAIRNPAIALPAGLGLPASGGWGWFYLYNEHVARFLSRRIPHDYGQVPMPVFWLLAAIWLMPWIAFLPGALAGRAREMRGRSKVKSAQVPPVRCQEATVALCLWAALVLGFFTVSARQEYYSLPALPALALLIGGLLARADRNSTSEDKLARGSALRWSRWFLLPLGSVLAAMAVGFAAVARPLPSGTDVATLLDHSQGSYNLSLGHLYDLTPTAMGLFRGPLLVCGLAMLTIGPVSYLLRRRQYTVAANLTLAGGSTLLLLSVHTGLVKFYPTLGSKALADSILQDQHFNQLQREPYAKGLASLGLSSPGADLILIDGELTAGSTLLFYTRQPAHLVEGRMNGPWYGSFWPDAPPIFETEATLHTLWSGQRRLYLLTYHAAERSADLTRFAPVRILSTVGGKAILTNRP